MRRVVMAGGLEAFLVTRYDDALAALSDARLSSDVRDASDTRLLRQLPEVERESMLSTMLRSDPPDHTRLRRLVSKAFTARRVAGMQPRIQSLTDRLLDALAPAGHADLVADFALPLPVTVISELLGVPVDDRHDFRYWTDRMIRRGAEPPRPGRGERGVAAHAGVRGRAHPREADGPLRRPAQPASSPPATRKGSCRRTNWWPWCSCCWPPATSPRST
ncbi:hypothetical protein AB0F11_29125 [Streptomyces sp. NPDC032472]|uniref:hypothetical protein n=1 Tax=Streptomyces sp. NPDC032472 TaxID=3155018 RepID=UPI0033BFE396